MFHTGSVIGEVAVRVRLIVDLAHHFGCSALGFREIVTSYLIFYFAALLVQHSPRLILVEGLARIIDISHFRSGFGFLQIHTS